MEVTAKCFHYEINDQLRVHPADFIVPYKFALRLKTLNDLLRPTNTSPIRSSR